MFGLKLFKRSPRKVVPPVDLPARAADSAPPVSRLTGPPPPPPPGAFASLNPPVAAKATQSFAPIATSAFTDPDPFVPIQAHTVNPQADFSPPAEVAAATSAQPGEPNPARVRFFYEDGSVSEGDAGESERLGYLANNLLEASRDDQT